MGCIGKAVKDRRINRTIRHGERQAAKRAIRKEVMA